MGESRSLSGFAIRAPGTADLWLKDLSAFAEPGSVETGKRRKSGACACPDLQSGHNEQQIFNLQLRDSKSPALYFQVTNLKKHLRLTGLRRTIDN